jgi:hypothetical protein
MSSDNLPDDLCICSDDNTEIPFALVKAKKRAAETGKLIWVYRMSMLFWMTDTYPENRCIVAKVYPGGRIELRKAQHDPS